MIATVCCCMLYILNCNIHIYQPSPPRQGTSLEASAHASRSISVLESHLMERTYLVGERVTMADIAMTCAIVFLGEAAGKLGVSISRWLDTCRNQPHFRVIFEGQDEALAATSSSSCVLEGVSTAVGGEELRVLGAGEVDGEDNAALSKLKELGVETVTWAHAAAQTVDEQMKVIGGLEGEKTKNLFLRVSG
ncbi:unnamed protein product [Choristocarpus tenellus]